MNNHSTLTLGLAVAAGMVCTSATAPAQSADALINKLVDKGILTTTEAEELRQEADEGFTQAYAKKSGMSEWVSALKFNGDFRGRYEGFYSDNPGFTERNRFRYRVRFGVTAELSDNFEVGLRLGSGDIDSGVSSGLDPISQNQTMQNNASKKGIFLDLAYGKWTPVKDEDWTLATTLGKMQNPYKFSDMVFDSDYTPEGFAIQLGRNLGEKHALKGNSGIFVLDEIGSSTDDPYMFGVQGRLESAWNPRFSTSAGAAYLSIMNSERLTTASVPNVNVGNTRNAAGALVHDYTPLIVDASATFKLDSFPMYPGAFPITVGGDYLNNSGAPASADNDGWSAGIRFGKAGKKGAWEFSYTYKWLGANAWWEELVDSDTGAFYPSAPLNGAGGAGYFAGSNVKGHVIALAYSPANTITLSSKVLFTELIDDSGSSLTGPVPADADSDMTRLQVDAQWKF